MTEVTPIQQSKLRQFFAGQRGRKLREAITAYLMVTPALLLIFTFGIFPVLFAVYVSLHRWKLVQGDFLGLDNYTKAVDNLAYIIFFVLSIGLFVFAWRTIKNTFDMVKENEDTPWVLLIPAALHAAAGILFIRWVVNLLPEFLDIANQVRKVSTQERTTSLYFKFIGDALKMEHVAKAFQIWIIIWIAAWLLTVVIGRWVVKTRNTTYLNKFVNIWLFSAGGVITLWFTLQEIQKAIKISLETGEEVDIWVQIVTIAGGVVLLFLAWRLWKSAIDQASNRSFIWRSLAAIFFLIGGWLLIAEIPAAIQAGDKDLWLGLKVTVFYAFGTVPFQLSISLVLAFLLFQKIRGKEFFRVLFFMPYVTPAIASAAVFRLLFSARDYSVVNSFLGLFNIEPQKWLIQPRGVFTIIAEGLGIENYPDGVVEWALEWAPEWAEMALELVRDWASGPSLALVVVIIYSIWVYVGYDVVIYLAGLGNISNEVNEAAEIDGASRWQILRHITLPLLSPTIYFLSLIAVIGTFKAFNHIFIMRDAFALGTIDTFSVAIFDQFYTQNRYGYASAMAFVLFAVILSITYINNKVQGSRVFYG